MRLRSRNEVWEELAHGSWLHSPDVRATRVEVQLLDATVLDQVPGRQARCRAAHWALRPTPLSLPPTSPPALRLIALILGAHANDRTACCADMEVLARLSGHSPRQTAELLDRLVAMNTLATWGHDRHTDEVLWELPAQHLRVCSAVRPAALVSGRHTACSQNPHQGPGAGRGLLAP
ncbi:helix-turn-helix domain-containing protein [Streptomyces sp. NPDC015414]|uniref:helix-turn-helix domain-containing protein n=1 Tax=Streptomyces sp. NPDC015414 TaxID=3364957 RepID=UPI0036F58CBF